MAANLESRLEQLGQGVVQDAPPLPEAGPFLAGVRRRGRARAMRTTLFTFAGVATAAAAVLLAALMNAPGSRTAPGVVEPLAVASDPDRPTIAALTQAAWNTGDIPVLKRTSSGWGAEPVHAATVHSKKRLADLGL